MNSNDIKKTATTVFIHKSAKDALTASFTDGDVNVTVFPEDIEETAAAELKNRLNPELQTKTAADGTVRKYYMTKGKVKVTFRITGVREDEATGKVSATATILGIEDAPNVFEKFGLSF